MKRKFLIIALCLACTASFAQTSKTSTAKKSAKTTTKPKSKTPVKADTTKKVTTDNNTTTGNAVQQPVVNKTPPAVKPGKPFERPVDGYYKESNIMNGKVTPLPALREADVVYKRRIWREIDLRDKDNQYMASPKGRLIDFIMDAVAKGELTAYDPLPNKDDNDPDGDAFSTPMTPEKAKLAMVDSSAVTTIDKNGEKTGSHMVEGEFNPDSVVKFRIKEDVIFDKQRSVEEVRIIGLAPLVRRNAAGITLDYQPAFWIYFPAARQVLVTKEIVNSHNDATGLSYDDAFTKRLFNSYIVKQSNDKDESIKNYANGIDRLYESEKIKKSLMDWELNLWQY